MSAGINTYVWNNNIKSMLLLCTFPLLFFILDFIYFYFDDFLKHPETNHVYAGLNGLLHTWHWVLLGVGAWFLIAYFSHERIILAATGAQPLTRKDAPELYNMLENLCIARGMTVPALYIMETPALNAFASGINQKTYAITVTRGLIDTLDAPEIQAVLGHELTHIMNSDVRLLIICAVFVGILSFLAQLGIRGYLRFPRGGKSSKNQIFVILACIVVLFLGYFLSILARLAISRRREFIADAGSVMLTKDPESMISALNKIEAKSEIPGVPNTVSSLFIDSPPTYIELFSTHPSIAARIEALKNYSRIEE